jgi:hypothetical protein
MNEEEVRIRKNEYMKKWEKKNYPRTRNRKLKYMKDTYINKMITLKRDFCSKCNEIGRYRLYYSINKNTNNVLLKSIGIDHIKYVNGKTKYDHMCYIYGDEMRKLLNNKIITDLIPNQQQSQIGEKK